MSCVPERMKTLGMVIKETTERHNVFIEVDLKTAAEESHHRAKQKAQRCSS